MDGSMTMRQNPQTINSLHNFNNTGLARKRSIDPMTSYQNDLVSFASGGLEQFKSINQLVKVLDEENTSQKFQSTKINRDQFGTTFGNSDFQITTEMNWISQLQPMKKLLYKQHEGL